MAEKNDEYTLISFIGKGLIVKGKVGEYETTTYQFPDTGKMWKTSVFVEAILKTEYRHIKKVILVGTLTSNWDLLIVDRDNNEDIYLKISEECNKNGISDESIKELKSRLQEWYNIPFEIIYHKARISSDTIVDIFFRYEKIPGLLADNTNILFDITHGFRSMPLLVYQSLQLNLDLQKTFDREVEVIYGELNYGEGKISPVHDLSEYWEYYEINSAIKLFEDKLDGRLLANKLDQPWKSGAKFLRRLSDIVECNFSLQIPEALKELKNALKDFNDKEKPLWVIEVRNKLAEIHKKLSVKEDERFPVAKIVWEYSKLLHEKKLITQEVIALQVVVETAMTEKIDGPKSVKIGNYDWFRTDDPLSIGLKQSGIQQLRKICRKNKKIKQPLWQLNDTRDSIAHGGGRNQNEDFPHQASIKRLLETIDDAIVEYFNIIDQEDN
jgi:CRISPR-associated Csx2 family protein